MMNSETCDEDKKSKLHSGESKSSFSAQWNNKHIMLVSIAHVLLLSPELWKLVFKGRRLLKLIGRLLWMLSG